MNENLKRLMLEAGYAAPELATRAQKLAQLIVTRSADKVSQMVIMDKGYAPQDPHSKGWNGAAAYAGKELKQHFGIKRMNERIFKIALTAMDFHGTVDTNTDLRMNNAELEKFAQLIVELCAEKVRGVLRDENSDLSYKAADQVQRALKELIND